MSLLKIANKHFKNGNYVEAYKIYDEVKRKYGFDFLDINIKLCMKNMENNPVLLNNIKKINSENNITTVDIIIPIYNALEDVKNCINSLYEHKTHDFNIIAIDDCSDDETRIYLEEESKKKGFKLLRNKENIRFTKTVNRGFKESKGDYVVILNSDTIVTPRWIEKILACFKSDQEIGIVGPFTNNGRWQSLNHLDELSSHQYNLLLEKIPFEKYLTFESVNGFCYAIKREVINKIGFFDELSFPEGYGEEDDYSIRARNAKFKIALVHNLYIYHAKSKSYPQELVEKLSLTGKKFLQNKYGNERLVDIKNSWENNQEYLNLKSTIKKYYDNGIKKTYKLKLEKSSESNITGWAVDLDDKNVIVDLDIYLNHRYVMSTKSNLKRSDLKRHELSNGYGGFNLMLPRNLLKAGENLVEIVLPNFQSLSSVIFLEAKEIYELNDLAIPTSNPVTIIVPIYNASDDLEVCIQRLLTYTTTNAKLLFIDDASPDKKIGAILSTIKDFPNVTVLKNNINLGFTKTVNKGIKYAGDDDVVLLNSDARVTPKWLEGLKIAANSKSNIATVTAMSDRAGAFSAPKIGNDNVLPIGVSEVDFAVAFKKCAKGLYPEVPTGNGFCLYIKRTVIDEIGILDDIAFPRGYGEENDFCMRAKKAGWINIIDDTTYVFHDRSKSFGEQKTELMVQGRAIIDKRYPTYSTEIQVFKNDSKIKACREIGQEAYSDAIDSRGVLPRILYVVSTQTGGTPQTNKDLMSGVKDAFETWVFRCNSREMFLSLYSNGVFHDKLYYKLSKPIDPLTHISEEYDSKIASWLNRLNFDIVHIRHLGWHSLSLPKIAKNSGAAVVNSFHDYYAVCPTIKLIDNHGIYCNGECTTSQGDCKVILWKDNFPLLKNKFVHEWRAMFSVALEACDAFITTSPSSKKTIVNTFPGFDNDNFHVIPHGRDLEITTREIPKENKKTFNILVPGNIDTAKGMDVILKLLECDNNRKLHFHILGQCQDKTVHERITYHGAYKREEFSKIVSSMDLDVGAVFSIWNETWCHTLTELWSVGLPTLVLDFDTIKIRVKDSGNGWIYNHNNINQMYDKIIDDLSSKKELMSKYQAVKEWQAHEAKLYTNLFMASKYLKIYSSVINKNMKSLQIFSHHKKEKVNFYIIPTVSRMSNTSVAPGSTHVRIWQKTCYMPNRRVIYIKFTPSQLITALKNKEVKWAIIQRDILSAEEWLIVKRYVEQKKFKYILDIDDDLLDVPKEKDPKNIYNNYSNTMRDIIVHSKSVQVSTPNLLERFAKYNSQCVLVPNVLNKYLWSGILNKSFEHNSFNVLYFGTPSHYHDYKMIEPALEKIAKQFPKFKLKVIGVLNNNEVLAPWIEILQIPNNKKNYPEFVKWLHDVTLDIHLGIAPLEDNYFNNTKSPLKILEYAGLELPIIASQGIVYNELGKEAPSVRLVKNSTEKWTEALTNEIERNDHRERGLKMKEWVLKHHTLDEEKYDSLGLDAFNLERLHG